MIRNEILIVEREFPALQVASRYGYSLEDHMHVHVFEQNQRAKMHSEWIIESTLRDTQTKGSPNMVMNGSPTKLHDK